MTEQVTSVARQTSKLPRTSSQQCFIAGHDVDGSSRGVVHPRLRGAHSWALSMKPSTMTMSYISTRASRKRLFVCGYPSTIKKVEKQTLKLATIITAGTLKSNKKVASDTERMLERLRKQAAQRRHPACDAKCAIFANIANTAKCSVIVIGSHAHNIFRACRDLPLVA